MPAHLKFRGFSGLKKNLQRAKSQKYVRHVLAFFHDKTSDRPPWTKPMEP